MRDSLSFHGHLRTQGLRLAFVAGVVLALAPAEEARADNPVAVALIGGGALLGGALIGATATITAAVITTYGGKSSNEGGSGGDRDLSEVIVPGTGDGGGDGDGDGDGDGGNAEESRSGATTPIINAGAKVDAVGAKVTLGEDQIDARARRYLDRGVQMTVEKAKNGGVVARVRYALEGDVLKADDGVAAFRVGDTVRWELDVKGPGPVPFLVHELTLSTKDVPATDGYSGVLFTAWQGRKKLLTWRAYVKQGQKAVHDAAGAGAKVESAKDRLHIENLALAIPAVYGKDGTAKVVVTMRYAGKGARTGK